MGRSRRALLSRLVAQLANVADLGELGDAERGSLEATAARLGGASALEAVRRVARDLVVPLLAGRLPVSLDLGGHEFGWQGPRVIHGVGGKEPLPGLVALIVEDRFPFGRCRARGCGRIFEQPRRGKPRRYCSGACKTRATTPRARQALYARNYRLRVREAEIEAARGALAGRAGAPLDALRKTFPTKSGRALAALALRARQKRGSGNAQVSKG